MDTILKQVDRAMDAGLYYLAVATALTLPDICAALGSADGTAKKERYEAWCETWLSSKYSMVTSADMYALRCGVSHQGKAGPRQMQYDRIVFVIPHVGVPADEYHGIVSDKAGTRVLALDAAFFCQDVVESVKRWYRAHAADPNVVANLPRVLQYRPNGLPPHFVGMPVIA